MRAIRLVTYGRRKQWNSAEGGTFPDRFRRRPPAYGRIVMRDIAARFAAFSYAANQNTLTPSRPLKPGSDHQTDALRTQRGATRRGAARPKDARGH